MPRLKWFHSGPSAGSAAYPAMAPLIPRVTGAPFGAPAGGSARGRPGGWRENYLLNKKWQAPKWRQHLNYHPLSSSSSSSSSAVMRTSPPQKKTKHLQTKHVFDFFGMRQAAEINQSNQRHEYRKPSWES